MLLLISLISRFPVLINFVDHNISHLHSLLIVLMQKPFMTRGVRASMGRIKRRPTSSGESRGGSNGVNRFADVVKPRLEKNALYSVVLKKIR
jgi:hypothetical protein